MLFIRLRIIEVFVSFHKIFLSQFNHCSSMLNKKQLYPHCRLYIYELGTFMPFDLGNKGKVHNVISLHSPEPPYSQRKKKYVHTVLYCILRQLTPEYFETNSPNMF